MTVAAAAPATMGLTFDHVGMTYSSGHGTTVAIGDISGTVEEGRFVSVLGPSGCGKSTLLELVAGLIRPTHGTVRIDGDIITGPRRDTAIVFQEDSTLHWRNVVDNIALSLEVDGVSKRERRQRAMDMVELVGLAGFDRHHPRQLSGGMRQRVAIARALVADPRLLLMDEPFGALDQQTRAFLGQELVRIWEETRKSVLFVTHDINEAVYLSDEVWVLSYRPSTVKEVVPIELERPRSDDLLTDPRFRDYVAQLWSSIKVEAAIGLRTSETA